MLLKLKVTDLITQIIEDSSYLDKKIELEGRGLIFSINAHQAKILDNKEDVNIKGGRHV